MFYNKLSIDVDRNIQAQSEIKAFNLDGISIAEETVINVSKDDFIKKPIKSIKELLRG